MWLRPSKSSFQSYVTPTSHLGYYCSLEKKRTETLVHNKLLAVFWRHPGEHSTASNSQSHYHGSGHFAHRILSFEAFDSRSVFTVDSLQKLLYKRKWEVCTLTHSVVNLHERALRSIDVDGNKSSNNKFALLHIKEWSFYAV